MSDEADHDVAGASEIPKKRTCKICDGDVVAKFSLPRGKRTGHAIPEEPDDCPYYECVSCHFLFADIQDTADQEEVYGDEYWKNQDPDWGGRVNQTLRLVLLANKLANKNPWELRVLDFGCGMGTFVASARTELNMAVWGTDIIEPKVGKEWYLKAPSPGQFDIAVSCEVIEHLPHPYEIMQQVVRWLTPGGVFAFQTAYYDPMTCGRDWWYLGPANGHISLYSREAFDILAYRLGVKEKLTWNGYPGVQAWRI